MSDEGYEMEYIKEAFVTNWVAPLGPNVDGFEKELASKIGVRNAVALSSGTAAIHMALRAAGVGKGDIVFCQSLTFAATANPIIYQMQFRFLLTAILKRGIWILKHWKQHLKSIRMLKLL